MNRAFSLILCLTIVLSPFAAGAEDGSTGLAFLKLGVGARAIAMGDAYTAVGGDASCVYWNPAGCVDVENIDVVLMHSEWFQGIRYEYAGGVRSDCTQAYGGGIVGLYMDDLDWRGEDPTAESLGTFGVFDFALSGIYARQLTDALSIGATGKYLHSKIEDEIARGFAVDLGAQYDTPVLEGLTAGLAIQNLGRQMKYIEDGFDLPVMYRLGAAYSRDLDEMNGVLLVVGDVVVPNDGDPKLHVGMEFEYAGVMAGRFGYRSGWDNQNISVGLGAKVRNFRLDYAYVPFYSDLGDTHRFSLGFAL